MPPRTQTLHLQLTIDGTPIEAAVPLPTARSPRRVLLPILYSLTDTLISLAEQSAATKGGKVSCTKGCDACCRQMVPISPTEAHALAAILDSLPPAKAARTLARFDAALEQLDKAGLLDRLMNRHTLSPKELQQLDRDYFAAGVSCPFLQNHACSVHPRRPLACREFLVTSDPRHCRAPGKGKVQQLPLAAKPSLALAATDSEPWLPLILARQFTAAHPETLPPTPPADQLTEILKSL
jgi:Fe-S-cluster containining protein